MLLTRLPFLLPGYGSDPDAWRAAYASGVIAATSKYEASRFPGNPVHEFAGALLARGGPLATNGLSALLTALAAGCFALILRRLGSRDDVLGGLALASAPTVALASVQNLDYAWGLAFGVAALLVAFDGRAVLAGLLVGLAIGCRLSSALWLIPAVFAIGGAGTRVRLVAVAALTGALCFLPVYLTYGPDFFRFYPVQPPSLVVLGKHLTVDLWGVTGTVGLALAAIAALAHARSRERALPHADAWLAWSWALTLALVIAAWIKLPSKAFYLIPAVPLVLLLTARYAGRPAFVVFALLTIAAPWTLKIIQPDRIEGPPPTSGVVSLRPLGVPWLLDARGPLPTERARRIARSSRVSRALEWARRTDEESVVVCWDWLPEIRQRVGGKQLGRVRFTYLMDANEARDLHARGVRIRSLPGADGENRNAHGVSLAELGATPLP